MGICCASLKIFFFWIFLHTCTAGKLRLAQERLSEHRTRAEMRVAQCWCHVLCAFRKGKSGLTWSDQKQHLAYRTADKAKTVNVAIRGSGTDKQLMARSKFSRTNTLQLLILQWSCPVHKLCPFCAELVTHGWTQGRCGLNQGIPTTAT